MERWCELQTSPKSGSYNLDTYGELAATRMADEWCHRMQYVYDVWRSAGSWEAAGGLAALGAYVEPDEFRLWAASLLPGQAALGRILQLRKMRPSLAV